MKIEPDTKRTSRGWIPVIAFGNGGRQELSSLYWSDTAAMKAAKHALKMRLKYPERVVDDPQPNQLVQL
tara:strand:- start:980 stop:1186 length:207 start_codon:yes stop_codon:yes gene_type:complete